MVDLLLPNLGLPLLTGFLAADAKTLGGFGLVWWGFTIPYQPADLGQTLPRDTFTNHYRLQKGTRSRLTYSLRWPASGIRVHSYKGR